MRIWLRIGMSGELMWAACAVVRVKATMKRYVRALPPFRLMIKGLVK